MAGPDAVPPVHVSAVAFYMLVAYGLLEINHWQSRRAYVRNLFPLPESGQRKNFMSQHRSLRAIATVGGKRNVLKRFERVGLLKKRGQWKEGDRITGLRKTKPDA